MGRTKTITDSQILEAARDVFLDLGFAATTAEIARRAGVSEGSIFRRWSSKAELFLAAMGIPHPPVWLAGLDELVGRGDLYQNLVSISTQILDFLIEMLPKRMVMMSCRGKLEDVFREEREPPPIKALKALTAFFEAERAGGRMRPAEPEVVARTLIGGLHHYAFAEASGLNERMPIAADAYVRGLVDTLWRGLAPASEAGPRAGSDGAGCGSGRREGAGE